MTAWKNKNVTRYYIDNRSTFKDLYKSESKLLYKLKKKSIKKILDFGCATGSFYKIFSKMFKDISYVGIDIEKEMIKNALKIYGKNRNTKFILSKKKKLSYKDNYFDLAFCTSVLHHVEEYKKTINELVRVSSKYIFIDSPRIHLKKNFVGLMNLDKRFDTQKKKKNNVKYYVANLKEYLLFIKKIIKNNNISKAYFVCNKLPYSKDYMSFSDEIFYMTILFVKNDENKNYDKYVYTNNKKVKRIFNIL